MAVLNPVLVLVVIPALSLMLWPGLEYNRTAWGQSHDPGRLPQDLPPLQPPVTELDLPEPPPTPPTPPTEAVSFTLSTIHLDGSTVYTPTDFDALYAPLLGVPITLADLESLARRLTARYRQDGYLLSQVIVPPQTVRDGEVRLQAIEGWIEAVEIAPGNRGEASLPMGIATHLMAIMAPLAQLRPLRWDRLEQILLMGQAIPGLTLTTVLLPGEQLGSSRLILRPRHQPVQGVIALDSYGSDSLGPLRLQTALFFNGLLGGAEQISLGWGTTPNALTPLTGALSPGQFRSINLGLTWPLGTQGWELVAQGSYSDLRPGAALTPFGLEAEGWRGRLGWRYNWVRQRQQQWTVEATAEFYSRTTRTTRLDPAVLLSQDQQGVLRLELTGQTQDAGGSWGVNLTLSQGIAGHSGSGDRPLSRQAGSPYFTRLRGEVTRRIALGRYSGLELGAIGQWSDRPLLVGEQFGLGGPPFGRGFWPSQVLGDRGFGLRAELQGWVALGARQGIQLYGFYDYGQVSRDRPTAAEAATSSLSSWGFGLRPVLGSRLFGELTLAFPRDGITPPRLFFSVQGSL